MRYGGKNKITKVVVAMSGGVDSSVAAALLKRQGYFVVGVFMKFWKPRNNIEVKGQLGAFENKCCTLESEKKAREVAKILDIPFYVLNFEKEFLGRVVDYFLKEYKRGKTPNPCVVCNKYIKFGLLIGKALKLGANYVATGHYVKIKNEQVPKKPEQISKIKNTNKKLKIYKLYQAKDKNKDQSYFLWQLNQNQLKYILFPIGDYTKAEVRRLAKKFKLPVADNPESQEICFIPKTINEFLAKYIKTTPGLICSRFTKPELEHKLEDIVGKHKGLPFYTIGQRKGIEIYPSKKTSKEKPYYVVAKDIKKNVLIVSNNERELLQEELVAKNVNWISGKEPSLPLNVEAKIRYRSELIPAVVSKIQNTRYKIRFSKKQRAITPGQSVVFYRKKELIGGGIIEQGLDYTFGLN